MRSDLSSDEQALAEALIMQVQPDELQVLRELCVRPPRFSGKLGRSFGYGVESGLDLIAPYAIVVAVWAMGIVRDEGKRITEARLRRLVQRLLHEEMEAPEQAEELTSSIDAIAFCEKATRYGQELGLDETRAALLANALVGSLQEQGLGSST